MKCYDIDTIVRGIITDLGEPNLRNFVRYKKYAIRAYREARDRLDLKTKYIDKTVMLDVDDKYTAPWPSDYISYHLLGICLRNGVLTLDLSDNICPDKGLIRNSCGNIEDIVQDNNISSLESYYVSGTSQYPYLSHFHNGQYNAGHFSYGDGFGGNYFSVDEGNNRFNFDSRISSKNIILVYKSDGFGDNDNAYVPEDAVNLIESYIHWQVDFFKNNIPQNQKTDKYHNYCRNARSYSNKKHQSWTLSEAFGVIRNGISQIPKR